MELIEYTATRYRCPHCRRSYTQRWRAERHEATCWASPEYKTCKGCAHFRPQFENGFTEPTCMKGEDPCIRTTTQFGEEWTGAYVAWCQLWEKATEDWRKTDPNYPYRVELF